MISPDGTDGSDSGLQLFLISCALLKNIYVFPHLTFNIRNCPVTGCIFFCEVTHHLPLPSAPTTRRWDPVTLTLTLNIPPFPFSNIATVIVAKDEGWHRMIKQTCGHPPFLGLCCLNGEPWNILVCALPVDSNKETARRWWRTFFAFSSWFMGDSNLVHVHT